MRQWSDDVQSTITSYKQRKPANLLLCTLIRQIFEIRFPLMFVGKNEQQRFGIQQLFLLEREEILALVYDIGLVQLGYSFFVWGEESVTELCRKLPRHEAEELIASLKIAVQVLIKDRPQAQFFISHILKDFDNIDDLIYSAGLWHLSVALLPASAIDYDRLRLRLPKPLANTFQSYQSIASSHKSLYNEEHLHAQQDHILLRVMILEQCGAIALQKNNKITLPVCFFHEEAILNILKMHTSKKETQLSREDKDSYGKTD
jgi:hypothetical protein